MRPYSFAAAAGDRGEGLGGEVVRRGVDQVAGEVDLRGERPGRARRRPCAPCRAAWRRAGRPRPAAPLGVPPFLAPLALLAALVGGEGVRAEQRALGDRGRRPRRRPAGSAKAAFLVPAARGRRCRRRGAAPLVVATRPRRARSRARPPARPETLRPSAAGQLGDLALGARCAEGFQHGGELSVERLVHGLGARGDDGALGALRHADDEGVGAQRRGAGSAESQSSHGGEVSLPYVNGVLRSRQGRRPLRSDRIPARRPPEMSLRVRTRPYVTRRFGKLFDQTASRFTHLWSLFQVCPLDLTRSERLGPLSQGDAGFLCMISTELPRPGATPWGRSRGTPAGGRPKWSTRTG